MSLLKEEGEDIGMKVIQLEEKTNKLENALAEISNETRAVLNDVRVVLTDLENPMNYLKGLGIDEVMLTMAENITENKLKEFMEKRLEALVRTVVEGKLKETVNALIAKFMEEQVGSIIEGKVREMKEKGILNVPIDVDELKKALDERLSEVVDLDEVKADLSEDLKKSLKKELLSELGEALVNTPRPPDRDGELSGPELGATGYPQAKPQPQERGGHFSISIVGVTACASALVKLFGKREAERVVDDNYRLGRIGEDLRSSLIRAMSIMTANDLPEADLKRAVGVDDHVIATYLFEKLSNGGTDMDFVLVTNLLGSYGQEMSDKSLSRRA